MLSPKRIASALLAALMLLPAVVFPAAAADDAGMSFTAGNLLTIAKDLDKAPLTYEAVGTRRSDRLQLCGQLQDQYCPAVQLRQKSGAVL